MPRAPQRPRPSPNRTPQATAAPDIRALVVRLLLRVGQGGRMTPLLRAALDRTPLTAEQKAFATELAYGTLRHQASLDAALEAHLTAPIARMPPPVREALRLGAYQLLHLRTPSHAAVAQSVALVPGRYGRLRGLANAVLRKLSADRPAAGTLEVPGDLDAVGVGPDLAAASPGGPPATSAELTARYSQPTWFIDRVRQQVGDAELEAALAANNVRPSVMVRVNACRASRDDVIAALGERGVQAVAHPHLPLALSLLAPGDVARLPGHAEGHFTVQDGAAQLVGHLAAVKPGMRVLDACAAPGGKTGHLLEAVGPSGRVVAADRHGARLTRVEQMAQRLGLADALATCAVDLTSAAAIDQIVHDCGGPFDCVVLDAPCSGMGTLRRHPELRQRVAESMAELALLQRALLDALAPALRPGGTFVYAVCSPLTAEGANQIKRFLAEHVDFAPSALPAVTAAFAQPDLGPGCIATWPHRHGLDGFFAARLQRQ